jgi:hypothetical protein
MSRHVVFLFFLLTSALILAPGRAGVAQRESDDALSRLTKAMQTEATVRRLHRLAVSDFTDLEGQLTPLGRYLAEELSNSLAMAGKLELVDRQQLGQILKASGAAGSPLDPAAIKKLDQAGLKAIIIGSYLELDTGVQVTAKLISTTTSAILTIAKATMPKAGAIEQLLQPHRQQESHQPEAETEVAIQDEASEGMVLIPSGQFLYGEDGHRQTISLPAFWMDLFEVTNAQYAKVRIHEYNHDKATYPVTNVSWKDAWFYCKVLRKRLPTEQEWEKAARGTDGRRYPWGDSYDPTYLNAGNQHHSSVPIGQFPQGRSPYGVYDLAGNVHEWTDSDEHRG